MQPCCRRRQAPPSSPTSASLRGEAIDVRLRSTICQTSSTCPINSPPGSPPTRSPRTATTVSTHRRLAVQLLQPSITQRTVAPSSGSTMTTSTSPCGSSSRPGRPHPTVVPRLRASLGSADDAVRALGPPAWTTRPLTAAEAVAWLAWAGASGGAHGRRRGAALGRFGALWVLAAILDLADEWPVPLDLLGARADALRWFWWEPAAPSEPRLAAATRRRGRRGGPRLGDQRCRFA